MFIDEAYNQQEKIRAAEDILCKLVSFVSRYPLCACEYCWRFKADTCICERPVVKKCFGALLQGRETFKDIDNLLFSLCLYSVASGETGCEVCWREGYCGMARDDTYDNDICYRHCLLTLAENKKYLKTVKKYLEKGDWSFDKFVGSLQ